MTSREAKPPITPGWGRVARRLQQARIDAGFPHRIDLVDELLRTGKAKLSVDRILGDLERGARSNYSSATISAVEAWYGLEPGEVRRVHAGEGETYRSPHRAVAARRVAATEQPTAATARPSTLSRLPADRLVEILSAIATELGTRAKHDYDDPAHLLGLARMDLSEDLTALDSELP